MGAEAQFAAMVVTCQAAGVKVYVDAVIDHMTGQGRCPTAACTTATSRTRTTGSTTSTAPRRTARPSAASTTSTTSSRSPGCELLGVDKLRTESGAVSATMA